MISSHVQLHGIKFDQGSPYLFFRSSPRHCSSSFICIWKGWVSPKFFPCKNSKFVTEIRIADLPIAVPMWRLPDHCDLPQFFILLSELFPVFPGMLKQKMCHNCWNFVKVIQSKSMNTISIRKVAMFNFLKFRIYINFLQEFVPFTER